MTNKNDNNNIIGNAFPEILREYETYLGLNPTNLSPTEYPVLQPEETPYSRLKQAEEFLGSMYANGTLTNADMVQISQTLALLTLRVSHMSMYSQASSYLILLPSKDNYYGIGRDKFQKFFGSMISLSSLSNKPFEEGVTEQLMRIVSQPMYQGKPMTLEVRVLNIMIMLLKVINDITSVSFLAQLLIQQDNMSK
mgnify:CR=1 FL=1